MKSLTEKFKSEAIREIPASGLSGSVSWQSPSNIALVKYWGKREIQLPMNPSVSLTLQEAHTTTKTAFSISKIRREPVLDYRFEGEPNNAFQARILKYLNSIEEFMPFLRNIELVIESSNSFPHSSGIASSASAFSALALCLADMENKLRGTESYGSEFFNKASFLARLGSGSAARSVYPGAVLWGETDALADSSDEVATGLYDSMDEVFKSFRNVILIVDPRKKTVSSSAGHDLMNANPFAEQRFDQARRHTREIIHILKSGDLHAFSELVEYEALCLHAMMLSSRPGYFLFAPQTLSVLNRIRSFRSETGIPVAFTLDAGANVHFLFPDENQDEVFHFIDTSLKEFCADGKYLSDRVGRGPQKL